jgi:hypothetical protein
MVNKPSYSWREERAHIYKFPFLFFIYKRFIGVKERLTYFLNELVRCAISGFRRGENEFALLGC